MSLSVTDKSVKASTTLALAPPPSLDFEQEDQEVFLSTGCGKCHIIEHPSHSDFLLHDIASTGTFLVEQEGDALATEYRTPPLWGVRDTGPYLHDGSAATLEQAVLQGHFREGEKSRLAYEELSQPQKDALIRYLQSL